MLQSGGNQEEGATIFLPRYSAGHTHKTSTAGEPSPSQHQRNRGRMLRLLRSRSSRWRVRQQHCVGPGHNNILCRQGPNREAVSRQSPGKELIKSLFLEERSGFSGCFSRSCSVSHGCLRAGDKSVQATSCRNNGLLVRRFLRGSGAPGCNRTYLSRWVVRAGWPVANPC